LLVPVKPRKVSEKTRSYEFAYEYPAAVAAIPALSRQLDRDLAKSRASLARDAREGAKDAKSGDIPFMRYSFEQKWQVVTQTPGWLSLSGTQWSFTGGAHGNTGYVSLLWNKARARKVAFTSMLTSPAAFNAVVQPAFCKALDAQRSARRGEQVERSADWPNDCIAPLEQTVILGSADHRRFTRIGFLVAPYAAGSYAEGVYEVTLPVTKAILATIKPAYRGAFAVSKP
jgi:Deacetylase PdaC